MARRLTLGLATLLAALTAVLLPAFSHAAPSAQCVACRVGGHGSNGEIAFVQTDGTQVRAIGPSRRSPATTLVGKCTSPNCDVTGELAWSRDGEKLAFVRGYLQWGGPDQPQIALFVVNADGGQLRRLLDCGDCGFSTGSTLAWSPDSSKIVVSDGDRLALVNVETGSYSLIGPSCAAGAVNPAWSPDGSRIAFGCGASLYVATGTGAQAHAIATPLSSAYCQLVNSRGCVADLSWSPDGKTIAFDDLDSIHTVGADGSRFRTLVVGRQEWIGPRFPSWSLDGARILYLKTPLVRSPASARGTVDAPSSGSIVPLRAQVWVMRADGTKKKRLYSSHDVIRGPIWVGDGNVAPAWSPNGKKIAFGFDTRSSSASGLMTMNADGTGRRRVGRPVNSFAWQPLH